MTRTASGFVDPEYSRLIGEICIVWNYLEDYVGTFSSKYMGWDYELASAVSAVIGNQSRVDLLSHLCAQREKDPEMAAAMQYFAKAFSICRENRNIVVHSAVRLKEPLKPEVLEKWSKSKPGAKVFYAYDLDSIRNVLNEMLMVLHFITLVLAALAIPALRLKSYMESGRGDPADWEKRPLPQIPPLPKKLIPLPPEAFPNAPPAPETQ